MSILSLVPSLLGAIPIPGLPNSLEIKAALLGVALIGTAALSGYAGYRWELSAYETLVAKDATALAAANAHQLDRQKHFDTLGAGESKTYEAARDAELARVKRELQEMKSASIPSRSAPGHHTRRNPGGGTPSGPDVVGVLRRAYSPN